MTTLDFVGTVPTTRGVALVQLHDELWRVTRPTGEVLGYIEGFDESGDLRFRAKRFFGTRRPSMPLGEFWRFDDAVECFRQ
jgi:putative heme degradation protein